MPAYLGQVGALDALKVASPMPITVEDRTTALTTLGGRVVAQMPTSYPRRVWTVSRAAATPGEWSLLEQYAHGLFGPGPFLFIDPWAQVGNVLTREQSLFADGWRLDEQSNFTVQTGRLSLPEGRAVSSWLQSQRVDGGSLSMGTVPVVPGVPVTVSAWMDLYDYSWFDVLDVEMRFNDAAGGVIDSAVGQVNSPPPGLARVSVTGTPPPAAVTIEIHIEGPDVIAAPQVTFTPRAVDAWAVGQSAQVVVSGGSHSPIIATPGAAYTSGSVTLREVG